MYSVELVLVKDRDNRVQFYRNGNKYMLKEIDGTDCWFAGKEAVKGVIGSVLNAELKGDTIVKCGYSKRIPQLAAFRRSKVKKWYMNAFPTDDYAEECMDPTLTFGKLIDSINEGLDIYDVLGVGDSLIRERVLSGIATALRLPYDKVYDAWLAAIRDNYNYDNSKLFLL